jgi:hypothetical protein
MIGFSFVDKEDRCRSPLEARCISTGTWYLVQKSRHEETTNNELLFLKGLILGTSNFQSEWNACQSNQPNALGTPVICLVVNLTSGH